MVPGDGATSTSPFSPGRRFLRPALFVLAGLAATAVLLRLWAVVWLNYLWYSSLNARNVFSGRYGTQALLIAVFVVAFLAVALVNVAFAEWASAGDLPPVGHNDVIDRYQFLIGRRHRQLLVAACVVLALLAGVQAGGQWRAWLLFLHGSDTGVKDPQFGRDLGFYLFRLPFLDYLLNWLSAAVVLIALAAAAVYYLNGGLTLTGASAGGRWNPRAKAHLSLLAAFFAVLRGCRYFFIDRPSLAFAPSRLIDGAGYTAVHARQPALMLLVLVSLFAAALLVVNVWRRGASLPAVAAALWLVVALLGGVALPAAVQRFRVDPQKVQRELPYIGRNQRATMAAYGLDGSLTAQPLDTPGALDADAVDRSRENLLRTSVLDPTLMAQSFQQLVPEAVNTFPSVSLDRYRIEGRSTPVLLGVRELRREDIPQQTWEATHLVFTHGKGMAAAPANRVTADGRPSFIDDASQTAAAAGLTPSRTQTYFGTTYDGWYVIVNSKRRTYDATRFEGNTGVVLSSVWRRLALSVATGDVDPLISGYLADDSQVLLRRSVLERVTALAPFLSFSPNATPVVVGGRLLWVVDGFTTADTYPYSQFGVTDPLSDEMGERPHEVNYMRSPVKATVDAYDGTVRFYRLDSVFGPRDPMMDAWSSAFPGLFRSTDDMPAGLMDHLQYPAEMLSRQAAVLGRYHVSDPEQFFDGSKNWVVARDPGQSVGTARAAPVNVATALRSPISSVHVYVDLPRSTTASFVRLLPFTFGSEGATQRADLTGFLVADQEPARYGRLTLFELTSVDRSGRRTTGVRTDGPQLAQKAISQDPTISSSLTLLNSNGSQVRYGAMTLVPLENSVVWVRPLYVVGAGGDDSQPALRKVVAVSAGKASMADTLEEAVAQLVDGSGPSAGTGGGTGTDAVARRLAEAGRLLDEGQAALAKKNGLAVYQRNQDTARRLIDQALKDLQKGTASSSPGESPPTTSTSPTTG